jgi:hypothetical protein
LQILIILFLLFVVGSLVFWIFNSYLYKIIFIKIWVLYSNYYGGGVGTDGGGAGSGVDGGGAGSG